MAVRGRDKFSKIKPILKLISIFYSVLPLKIRKILFEHYRGTKGLKGIAIRYVLLKSIAKKCGDNVAIHPNCYIFAADNLEIGDNVSIHPMCYIDATGGIEIGDDVSIAHAVSILSTSHNYSNYAVPIKDQGCDYKKTVIGNNVWLGAKATVMYGRHIGDGVIIGANSVVTRDIEDNMIAAGSPAKVIKER